MTEGIYMRSLDGVEWTPFDGPSVDLDFGPSIEAILRRDVESRRETQERFEQATTPDEYLLAQFDVTYEKQYVSFNPYRTLGVYRRPIFQSIGTHADDCEHDECALGIECLHCWSHPASWSATSKHDPLIYGDDMFTPSSEFLRIMGYEEKWTVNEMGRNVYSFEPIQNREET